MAEGYWFFEYAKVLAAYVLLMFVWPSVVFRGYLRGKGKTVRFCFCVTVQVLLVNTVVLGLGLLHILNPFTVCALFYGVFLFSLLRGKRVSAANRKRFRRLLRGTEGMKWFLFQAGGRIRGAIRRKWADFWQANRSHMPEYAALAAVILFGMLYFSYGVFQNYSYGSGDMYVHHQWIQGLIEGQIFYDGIYPEAMHCFVYSLHTLFGIRVYSIMLFLAGIHVAVLFAAVYLLLKEVFHWRYTGIFVLTLFLTVELLCVNEIAGMSRLQWTIPQEFGMYSQFLCVLFLLRYIKGELPGIEKENRKGEKKRVILVWNENLLLFMTSLGVSLAVHFYITIMAFFLCASFALFSLRRIFSRGYFRGLVLAVLCGFFIAAAPMGLAFASGMPFQGSIGWALNVIRGTDGQEETEITESQTESGLQGDMGERRPQGSAGESGLSENTEKVQVESPAKSAGKGVESTEASPAKRMAELVSRGQRFLVEKFAALYENGYRQLYLERGAACIIGFTLLGAALWLGFRLVLLVLGFVRRLGITGEQKRCFDGYPSLLFASVLFMILYAAPSLGLPSLLEPVRLCTTEQLLILCVAVMPFDMLFSLLSLFLGKRVLHVLSVACVGGIYAMTVELGIFHGYLYCELTRYNSAVMVTNEIIAGFPENSYTVVSTTDELYQVTEYGRHEEILSFLDGVERSVYTLPTKYIFVYVEKTPIERSQNHFFAGPDWLAQEKYPELWPPGCSEGEDIHASEISPEAAEGVLSGMEKLSDAYSDLDNRTLLQSKLYEWCAEFGELYEKEMNIYYEDDNLICYLITQNPNSLFHLEVQ